MSTFERLFPCYLDVDGVGNPYFSLEVPSNWMRIAKATWSNRTARLSVGGVRSPARAVDCHISQTYYAEMGQGGPGHQKRSAVPQYHHCCEGDSPRRTCLCVLCELGEGEKERCDKLCVATLNFKDCSAPCSP